MAPWKEFSALFLADVSGSAGLPPSEAGPPLPFVELLREFSRLRASFSFMRRTFHRELVGRDIAAEMAAVQTVWKANNRRSPVAVENDHRSFQALLTLLRASAVGSIREDTSLPFSES